MMIEIVLAVALASLGISVANLRCIHRIEKDMLRFVYESTKTPRDLDDK